MTSAMKGMTVSFGKSGGNAARLVVTALFNSGWRPIK